MAWGAYFSFTDKLQFLHGCLMRRHAALA